MQGRVTITSFSAAVVAGTKQTLVAAPAAGKKLRVLGYDFSPSAAAGVIFTDRGNADAVILRGPVCAINTPDTVPTIPGEGVIVPTAAAALGIDVTANATIVGWVATAAGDD